MLRAKINEPSKPVAEKQHTYRSRSTSQKKIIYSVEGERFKATDNKNLSETASFRPWRG